MVGVPGRSKACNTCRQRKVACSLEKPECRTCVKASRVCAGYQRERVFILGAGTSYQVPKETKTSSFVNGAKELSIRHRKTGSSLVQIQDNSSEDSPRPIPIPKIRPLSSNGVYRQQILYEFLASAFPANVGAQDREKINGNWLRMIPALPESTIALETSMLAVSTAKLGRLNDNQVLIHESLRLYVQGLWELQKALWDPKLMHNNETLAACMALIVYEVVECPDKTLDGWVSHMRGCAKMFELKGPGAYDSDFGHQLFLSFRVIEIQQALAERRNTFLASPDWMSLPFKNRPKSTFQQLLDSVVKVPNIIADGYQMLQAPLEGTASLDPSAMVLFILGLVDRCWKVDAQLSEFYATLEKETLGPVYWPELSNDFDVVDTEAQLGKVFPVAFKFLDMRMAHICLIYWATNCILWSGMAYTYKLLLGLSAATAMNSNTPSAKDESLLDITQLPPLGHRTDVTSMAKNICQAVEYCLGDEHRGLGARAAVFPLKVAIETLHDAHCDRELLWAQAAMARADQTGIRIMKHLPDPMTDHAFLPG